jgi:hypothetical protein
MDSTWALLNTKFTRFIYPVLSNWRWVGTQRHKDSKKLWTIELIRDWLCRMKFNQSIIILKGLNTKHCILYKYLYVTHVHLVSTSLTLWNYVHMARLEPTWLIFGLNWRSFCTKTLISGYFYLNK